MGRLSRWVGVIVVVSGCVAGAIRSAGSDAAPAAGTAKAPWSEILGPAQGTLPIPQGNVVWRPELAPALAEAAKENRPVFVTLRCLPCKQCSAFDKAVLEGGLELDPLLKQFVTVRLTDANTADLRILPMADFQDLDLSWWGYFLSPKGQVYGVFGGRDKVSDDTRISPAALANTLKRVLAHHYDPRRAGWNVDGLVPASDANDGKPSTAKDLPGYEAWHSHGGREVREQKCVHCHQVSEILREPLIKAGKFNKERDLEIWPLPENVGIVVDRDDGLKVKSVTHDSPAAKAGLKPGDELAAAASNAEPRDAAGRRLFSQADLRGVLHRGPRAGGMVDLWWVRDGKVMNGTLDLPAGWRAAPEELEWRMSVSQGNIGVGPGFFPIAANPAERKARGIADGAMAVKPFFGQNPTVPVWQAGMRREHVVTAVDGRSPNVAGRAFLVWFRRHYDPGDAVTFTVVDQAGQSQKIRCTLPAQGE